MSPDSDNDVQKDPIVTEIAVHEGPIAGVVVSPDGGRLMVTNYGADSVSIIDTDSCRVVDTVAGVREPFAIAAAGPDRVYVSSVSPAYDSIEVIDASTGAVVATHPLALSVSDLAVSADGRYVYAGRNGTGGADVAVVDTTTGRVEVIDIAGPGTTAACVRTGADGAVYVGTNGPAGGKLVVLGAPSGESSPGRARWRRKTPTPPRDGGLTVTGVVEIGLAVRDVALSPDGALAYVASCCPEVGAVVDVVDTRTNKITSTCKLGEISGNLTGCTISRDGDRAYLVSDEGVTVLCTLTEDIIGTIAVTQQPSCVVESPDGKRLYVADYSGAVSVAALTASDPAAPLAIEGAPPRSHASADWLMPQVLRYEPALAK
ncbi:YncE family protein [Mycobacterium conspicuum]|uniref:YVTN family beta-propeller repeat protein n=1 Tax=Mycobacterium conspicuum TaxID=44010 RepID=A0A7I7YHB2_9MYCO|nr:YncE family protein [Mycobacterium conspicuum]BBZ41198.1 hypothetical protein MCNS_42610 [Mycobacterium conspicuum]